MQTSYKKPSLPAPAKHPQAPIEIWLNIISFCNIEAVLNLRGINRAFLEMANKILRNRLGGVYTLKIDALSLCKSGHEQLVSSREPLLEHYREFLLPDTSEFLNELCWYATVPREVRIVVQCILRLKGHSNANTWSEQRKILKSTDFRLWINSLPVHVNHIDIKNTRAVEYIIRNDPAITYVRLRAVSMAGYQLLIVVAACLQYSSIHDEIDLSKNALDQLARECSTRSQFMAAIEYK